MEGRSTRKWSDQDAAFRQMQAAGIDESMLYIRTPISLTVAEKLIGKKQFAETMSAFITKAPARLSWPMTATRALPITIWTASKPRRTNYERK